MKPRTRKTGATGTAETKPAFVVSADFTPEQTQIAWKAFLKTQPPIAEQPKPKPEIRMSDHLANVRADAATRPRTRSARPIGKLPLALERGGIDAVLWPWFRRWIETPHNRSSGEWQGISDQGRYLCALVDLAVRPNSKESKVERAF